MDGPHFLGQIVNHAVLDPRDGRTLLAAARAGHLGPPSSAPPTAARTWKEAARPPAFAKARRGRRRATPSTTSSGSRRATRASPGAGTRAPRRRACSSRRRRRDLGGCRRASTTIARRRRGSARGQDAPPDGAHAALDHRRSARSAPPLHRPVGAAACSRRTTRAPPGSRSTAAARPTSCPIPMPSTATIRTACACTRRPDVVYQQNHCGIYRLDRPRRALGAHRRGHAEGDRRHRLSDRAASARSDDGCGCSRWTAPRSGRACPSAASPRCTARATRARRWQRQDRGLPPAQAWFTVKRQAMCADALDPWASTSAPPAARSGRAATRARAGTASRMHLPHIYSVEAALVAMKVVVPSPLAEYTAQPARGRGATAPRWRELLADLDRRFPGIRFRMIDEQDAIRPHIKIFVNREQARSLGAAARRRRRGARSSRRCRAAERVPFRRTEYHAASNIRKSTEENPMIRKSLIAALAAGVPPTGAQAQTEIQFWHSMGGALGDKVSELADQVQREPEGLQGRRHLQGQLSRVDDRRDRRLPRRQRAAHPAGVRGRHRHDDGRQGRDRARWPR